MRAKEKFASRESWSDALQSLVQALRFTNIKGLAEDLRCHRS